jgi:predicted anti-sigma-YlaC factor YlaD
MPAMTKFPRRAAPVLVAMLVLGIPGCALRKMALGSVANSLAKSGDTFSSDEDPELIRAAVPFSLKLVESLLAELPQHRGLLLSACSGFTQFGYAFVDGDAEFVREDDYARFIRLQDRARRLYLRARGYCMRNLELKYPGIGARLAKDPAGAAAGMTKADVPVLYWTGASWGKAVSLSLDRPALVGDLPIVQALIRRALQLDEAYQRGALHEVMISLESVPEAMGGSPVRARQHFDRAIALSNGHAAGPYVSFARSVLVPQQNRGEFVRTINDALRVDIEAEPSLRLANVLAQEQARYLLDHLDNLFVGAGGWFDPPLHAITAGKRMP